VIRCWLASVFLHAGLFTVAAVIGTVVSVRRAAPHETAPVRLELGSSAGPAAARAGGEVVRERVGAVRPAVPRGSSAEADDPDLPSFRAADAAFNSDLPADAPSASGSLPSDDPMLGRLPEPDAHGRPGESRPRRGWAAGGPSTAAAGPDSAQGPESGPSTGVGGRAARRTGGHIPRYPLRARREGWEGTVTLDLLISESGRVTEVRVSTSSGHACLDRAAEDAARSWSYAPETKDGRPVPATVRVPVTFRLTDLAEDASE